MNGDLGRGEKDGTQKTPGPPLNLSLDPLERFRKAWLSTCLVVSGAICFRSDFFHVGESMRPGMLISQVVMEIWRKAELGLGDSQSSVKEGTGRL